MINPIILKYYMENVKKNLNEDMLRSIVEKHGEDYLLSLIEKAAKRRINSRLAWNESWSDIGFKKAS